MELQLQRLCKQYGTKAAVDQVSVHLEPGVYGLLGANGAGKTMLMRMICGVLKPTSGSIRLNGKTIQELGEQYYTHLGYMPQDFGFYPDFTARGTGSERAGTFSKYYLRLCQGQNRDLVHPYRFGCFLHCGYDPDDETGQNFASGIDGRGHGQYPGKSMGGACG